MDGFGVFIKYGFNYFGVDHCSASVLMPCSSSLRLSSISIAWSSGSLM